MRARVATITAVLLFAVAFAQAKEKDHSAEYQAGTFSSTGSISDGSYSAAVVVAQLTARLTTSIL